MPYITAEPERIRANFLTSIDFTKEELYERLDTEGAVDYINRLISVTPLGKTWETDSFWTLLNIDLGYLVDSRLRTDKNKKAINEEDILKDIFTVRISFPTCLNTGGVHRYSLTYRQKTFLVDLDEFTKLLEKHGWELTINSEYNVNDILKDVLEKGFDMSPQFSIVKNFRLNSPAIMLTQNSHKLNAETRETFIRQFFEHFYPNLDLKAPNCKQDQIAKNLCKAMQSIHPRDDSREIGHNELDEIIYLSQEFIEYGVKNETAVYRGSKMFRLLKALEIIGTPIKDLSVLTLESVKTDILFLKISFETPLSEIKDDILSELESFEMRFESEDNGKYPKLAKIFRKVIKDIRDIFNLKDGVTLKTLEDDIAELNYERSLHQPNWDDNCLGIAEELFERTSYTYIYRAEDLSNGMYDLSLNWNSIKDKFVTLGFDKNLSPLEILSTLYEWVGNLIQILSNFNNQKNNHYDYDLLTAHLIDCINRHLVKTQKQLKLCDENL